MEVNWFNKVFGYFKLKIKNTLFWNDELFENLRKNKNITDTMGENEQPNQQRQGFPCPECNTVTPITMEMLVYNQPIFCAGCGIKFSILTSESHSVIEDLKKVHKAQQELKDIKGVKAK